MVTLHARVGEGNFWVMMFYGLRSRKLKINQLLFFNLLNLLPTYCDLI